MTTGSITKIHDERGFGFIAADDTEDGAELFFHHSAVRDGGFESLRVGQRVAFEAGADPRNPERRRANDVSLIVE
jgi:CspA family cold shock protein